MRHLWRAFAFQLATLLSKDNLRAVRHSKAVIKLWGIILLLAYMMKFALQLNGFKVEYKAHVESSQLFRSLNESIATSPQCDHTSPSSSACAFSSACALFALSERIVAARVATRQVGCSLRDCFRGLWRQETCLR